MNLHKRITLTIITTVLLFTLFITAVSGDIPVHSTPELAGLSTATLTDAQGISVTTTELRNKLGTETLNDPPLENGGFPWEWDPFGPAGPFIEGYTTDSRAEFPGTPVPPGEVQYTAGYNQEVTSVSGRIVNQNTMSIS